MSSTFSPSLRIELIGDGDQSGIWGQTTNSNLGTLIEQAITGVQTITMLDATYTLSNYNGVADEARNQVLVLTGTNTAQRNLIAPLVEKTYSIKNSTTGGFGVQIVGASGTGVVIPNGQTIPVYCDGTNFYALVTGTAGNFAVAGNETISGTLAVSGTSTLTGNTSVGGTLAVTGTSTFTGIPSGPTAAYGTNTTQLATTAFVQASLPSGVILLWSGSIASIPSGWYLCNGSNGTPDLRNRFLVGAGSTYSVGDTGGSANATLVSHTHTATVTDSGHTHSISDPGHTHGYGFYGNVFGGFPGTFAGDYVAGGSSTIGIPNNIAATASSGGLTINSASTGITGTNSNTTGISVSNSTQGTSATNANLPPYYALAYIMKA